VDNSRGKPTNTKLRENEQIIKSGAANLSSLTQQFQF